MKTLKTLIISIFLGALSQSNTINAQEYLQLLDPIFIIMETESEIMSTTYMKFNDALIASQNFRFKKAIRKAEKEDAVLFESKNDHSFYLRKAQFLRILRKAANRTENVSDFTYQLSQELPEISILFSNEADTEALYNFARSKTINGKLDKVGNDLTWL